MGQSRTLTRKINPASLEIAQHNAAKRAVQYMHLDERLRWVRNLHLADKERAAKLMGPNRAS